MALRGPRRPPAPLPSLSILPVLSYVSALHSIADELLEGLEAGGRDYPVNTPRSSVFLAACDRQKCHFSGPFKTRTGCGSVLRDVSGLIAAAYRRMC